MIENPVWKKIWDELEADFRRRRADERLSSSVAAVTEAEEMNHESG